jgi:hypothetical protein
MWFIKYQVKVETDDILTNPIETGIVYAESFGKAAEQIEDYYGPDLLEILQLKYLDERLILSDALMKKVEEEINNEA